MTHPLLIAPFAEDEDGMIARAIPRFASERGQKHVAQGVQRGKIDRRSVVLPFSLLLLEPLHRYLLCELCP